MKSLFLNPLARPGAVIAFAVAALSGGAAHAAGTLSGTSISNLATLSYSVGGTAQTSIGSSAGGNTAGVGTATSFVVDNKVNLLLVETGAAVTSVAPGATNQVTTFTVNNSGNTAQGYTFAAANQSAASAVIDGTADGIDVSNLRVFVDANANGTYEAGTDTATAILTLAPDATVSVFVLTDIPAGATNSQQANVTLTATTTTVNTATAVVATAGADTAGVDIVFADAATAESAFVGTSAARDGQATARDAYRISSAVISVFKTSALICDPSNGNLNPKNIPGAAVQYAITITNASSATASATLSQITDALVGALVFDPKLNSGALPATNCVSGNVANTLSASGFGAVSGTGTTTTYVAPGLVGQAVTAGATVAGQNVTINYLTLASPTYALTGGVLPANSFVTVYFNVFVQ